MLNGRGPVLAFAMLAGLALSLIAGLLLARYATSGMHGFDADRPMFAYNRPLPDWREEGPAGRLLPDAGDVGPYATAGGSSGDT